MPAPPWMQKIGGLFSDPRVNGGVFGEPTAASPYDPRMAMASELLSQSGYAPYKRPFGEVLGRAMQAAQQARALGVDREQQKKVQDAQIAASNAQAARASAPDSPFGNVDPAKFTPESVAAFQATKDYSKLVPIPKIPGETGETSSLQEIAAMNDYNTRKEAGKLVPGEVDPSEYLAQRRGSSADSQLYAQYVQGATARGEKLLPIEQFLSRFRGEVAGSQQLGEVGMKRLDTQYDAASQARAALNTIGEAEDLLDAGIRTGTAATQRNAIARAFDTVLGRQTDDEALSANTDAYLANQGQLVGQAIKAFGAGTGLSDADREFATQMAAGSVQVNEATLRKVLEIQRKVQTNLIDKYNRQYDRLSGSYNEVADFYERIDVPQPPSASARRVRVDAEGNVVGD